MKTGEDFRHEFPEMSQGFETAARRALHELREQKGEKQVRFRPTLLVAAVLVLLMSVGVAATWERWSMTDFINRYREVVTGDEWKEMVSGFEPVNIHGMLADAVIREAVYDGFACHMVVEVRPYDPRCFLIPFSADYLEYPAYQTVRTFPKDVTLKEHIAALGYTNVTVCSIHVEGSGGGSKQMELNPDGSFVFYLYCDLDDWMQEQLPELKKVQLSLLPTEKHGIPTYMHAEMTVQRQPLLEAACTQEGATYEFSGGLRLDRICMYRTPLSAYLVADAEIFDSAALQDCLYIPKAPDGTDLPMGASGYWGLALEGALSYDRVGCQYRASLALDSLPDEIVLAEMDWRTERITDSWAVQLIALE